MIAQTIFELFLVALVILALIFEPQLIAWEDKVFAAIKKKHNERKASARRKSFVVITND